MDDQLVLDLSAQREYPAPFVRNSEWLYVLDQTSSGSYTSGQSILETSSLSNSNKWLNWTSAYLAVPSRIRMTNDSNAAGVIGQFAAGIKNGFHNAINSCQVEINGVTVQQATQLSNLVWGYRLMTSLSYNDVLKFGSVIGFWPDSSNSWLYTAVGGASRTGIGYANNIDGGAVDVSAVAAGTTAVGMNEGFLKRQTWLSYATTNTAGAAVVSHSNAASNTQLAQVFKSYCTSVIGTGAGTGYPEVMYNFMAIIRLKDICPLFEQLGLCKGLLVRLTMTLNQPTFKVGIDTAATPNLSVSTAVSFPYGGQTNNVMIAATSASCGNAATLPTVAGAAVYTVDYRVGTTPFSSTSTSTGSTANTGAFGQTNIRLWVQSCILAPEQEAELLAQPVRSLKYNDIYEMDFTVANGATANQLLFNSVPRCRRLIMIPQSSVTDHGITSPFDSAGGCTTLPMCGITNFQVYLSGMPLFLTPTNYDYRVFLEQSVKTGVNYGLVDGISSGLIGLDQWQNNYRYYIMDLHQGLESEDDVVKNIQVSFSSQSSTDQRWYCFVEYERQLELNILSSAVISFK